MEPSRPRRAASGSLHPARRGDRSHRADRRVGAQRSLPTEQGLAGRGLATDRRGGERLCAAVQGEAFRRHRRRRASRPWPGAEIPGARAHREPDHAGRRPGGRDDEGAEGPRGPARDRRLRHRLFEPKRAEDFSHCATQDR